MSKDSISDKIGRIGERYFEDLADKADLLVGRIEPDCLGKDRVVEFALNPRSEGMPYDTRPAPISCSFQIKTILKKNERVRLSLSVAERLAGDVRPAFVAILRVNDAHQVIDMHLVHIYDNSLAQILMRLRQAFADGKTKLNKLSTSFKTSDGRRVELNPSALKKTIIEMVGTDMDVYAQRKKEQRSTIGYSIQDRITAAISFSPCPIEEFVEGMLGIRELGVERFDTSEIRFGIKTPLLNPETHGCFSSGKIRVEPTPIEGFLLEAQNKSSREVMQLPCGVILPAVQGIPVDKAKFIVKSNMFQITMGAGEFKPVPLESFRVENSYLLSVLYDSMKFWKMLHEKNTSVTLKSPTGDEVLSVEITSETKGQIANLTHQIYLLECLKEISIEANVEDQEISLTNLFEKREEVLAVYAYFRKTELVGEFYFEIPEKIPKDIDGTKALIVGRQEIGNVTYAYGLNCRMDTKITENGTSFKSKSLKPLEIKRIMSSENELDMFAKRLQKISDINLAFVNVPTVEPVT
ncbi:hypothetical protein [Roseibium alexandrii]|uniref:hypothetical protein n=1 Tax=Roseibium alexandrii TaxID=388408 RepID=UPI0037525137